MRDDLNFFDVVSMELKPERVEEDLAANEEGFWRSWQDHVEDLLTSKSE